MISSAQLLAGYLMKLLDVLLSPLGVERVAEYIVLEHRKLQIS
jgi:hypothetical protein